MRSALLLLKADDVGFAAERRYRIRPAALRHNVTGTVFALTALCCNTQFKLNVVKAHACPHVAMDFAVRNALADTNNHGVTPFGWLVIDCLL